MSLWEQHAVQLRMRRCKIVATLGPASSNPQMIASLIERGVDVFRLNMSHGNHSGHEDAYRTVRQVALEANRHVAVLADLCGPKIRVGTFVNGSMELIKNQTVFIHSEKTDGGGDRIPSAYPELAGDVKPGSRILLDDGNLELKVMGIVDGVVEAQVTHGGLLKDRKGMNLPDSVLSVRAPTEKDLRDAQFALGLGVDFLALSFVRSARDLEALRKAVGENCPPIIAKIEMPEALNEIESIIQAADGLMVARGDLGVELPAEDVPIVQDLLVDLGRRANKPVIVATQMLDSMIRNPRPTRAEVTDISHAVWRGSDAVMLSGETAAGAFPALAVETMDKVARRTEGYMWTCGNFEHIAQLDHLKPPLGAEDAFAKATALMSRDLRVRAVAVISRTGRSANVVSSARPAAPIVAISPSPQVCRQMNLLWGVHSVVASPQSLERPIEVARRMIVELGLAEKGDRFLLARGFHLDSHKDAPSVTILQI